MVGAWWKRYVTQVFNIRTDTDRYFATIVQDELITGWQKFLDSIIELDVYDAPTMKRLLDGRSLASALGVKPGKWTGKALDVCLAWQLRNPQETDPSGAIEEIQLRRGELGIPKTDR